MHAPPDFNGIDIMNPPTTRLRYVVETKPRPATTTAGEAPTDYPPRPDDVERGNQVFPGERPQDRTLMLMLSLAAMVTMTFLLGSRFNQLKQRAISKRNITCVLVLSLYVLVMAFFTSIVVLHAGQGLYDYEQCFALTWVCLVLYAMSKSVIYIFLVERIHVVRAPFASRTRDWIYLSSMLFMIGACGGIVINAWLHPYTAMDPLDGRCHNGISKRVTIPFLTVDIMMDFVLTGVFVYLLHPFVKGNWLQMLSVASFNSKGAPGFSPSTSRTTELSESTRIEVNWGDSAVNRSIMSLLRKSIVGAFAITIVTVSLFLVQYTVGDGGEGVALICSSICLGDVFWGYLVIHYLTFCSLETEENMSQSSTLVDHNNNNSDDVERRHPPRRCPSIPQI